MKRVFADALYWIAATYVNDQWHRLAQEARSGLGPVHLVTTDEVLTEFLAALAAAGSHYRRIAAETISDILEDETITVLPQSRDTFLAGLELYKSRADKGYSLTDCVSMNAMRESGITEVLTNDHHFAQEGFVILIAR